MTRCLDRKRMCLFFVWTFVFVGSTMVMKPSNSSCRCRQSASPPSTPYAFDASIPPFPPPYHLLADRAVYRSTQLGPVRFQKPDDVPAAARTPPAGAEAAPGGRAASAARCDAFPRRRSRGDCGAMDPAGEVQQPGNGRRWGRGGRCPGEAGRAAAWGRRGPGGGRGARKRGGRKPAQHQPRRPD